MPELPEVETFVRRLAPAAGRTVAQAIVSDPRLTVSPDELTGALIEAVSRRGKYILLDLGDRGDLVLHLRMSGRLRFDTNEGEIPYTRMRLRLDDGKTLYFIDPRRLGTAVLYRTGFDADLGIEPLGPEFTATALGRLASVSRAPIKSLLMDQRRIAGIGNIYAAEALWRSGIDPRRPARDLSEAEVVRLQSAVVTILEEAVEQLGTTLGTSVSDYRPSASEEGSFQNRLLVYGREGKACDRCATVIERIVQAGRSTCFCPGCQT